MYSLGNLMNIDSTRQNKAGLCTVKLLNVYHELKPASVLDKFKAFFGKRNVLNKYKVIFKLEVKSDTGKIHNVYIRTNPDFDLNKWDDNKAEIYCDCEDFKYRSAYILNLNKSLFLNDKTKTSLGSAITEKPKKLQTTLLCKHAFAAVQWLINNYPNIMKTI